MLFYFNSAHQALCCKRLNFYHVHLRYLHDKTDEPSTSKINTSVKLPSFEKLHKIDTRESNSSSGPKYQIRLAIKCAIRLLVIMFRIPDLEGRPGQDNFTRKEIEFRYNVDRFPIEEWCLVYNDRFFTLAGHLISWFSSLAIVFAFAMCLDYFLHDRQFSFKSFKKIQADSYDMGPLIYVVLGIITFSSFVIFITHRRFTFCMYMNRSNLQQLKILTTKGLFQRGWIDANLSQIRTELGLYESTFFDSFFRGNISICGKSKYINSEAFRTNQLRTYILGETKRPPSIDNLDLKDDSKKYDLY